MIFCNEIALWGNLINFADKLMKMCAGEQIFMRRALQLAQYGDGFVSPNPMVGAVIVCNGKIIGEGFHRKWGEAHAEVNAVKSVSDKSLLRHSEIYVTLEPCSHYGKTPPCAELLIKSGIPKVIIGSLDPFEKVRGRGVKMLRDAGIEVVVGMLENECVELNRRFFNAHIRRRPYVLLKWAQSKDGFLAHSDGIPELFSNSLSKILMHRERSRYDAIMVGTNTVISDNPQLTVREWSGNSPIRICPDISARIPKTAFVGSDSKDIIVREHFDVKTLLSQLYENNKITSLMVEGGAKILQSFLDAEIFDEVRIEVSPKILLKGIKAPIFRGQFDKIEQVRGNVIALKRS